MLDSVHAVDGGFLKWETKTKREKNLLDISRNIFIGSYML